MSLDPANKRPNPFRKRKGGNQFVFLVVGVYEDDYQRFAESYAAADAGEAEHLAVSLHPGLIVAGVIDTRGEVVA
jgi:hypothetical protein